MSRRTLALLAMAMILPALLAAQAFAAAICNEPVPAPKFEVGEKWTSRDERGTESTNEVIQVEGGVTQMIDHNGNVAFYDQDRIIQKVRKKNGEVVTSPGTVAFPWIGRKTMDFPLHIGKQWQWSYHGNADSNTSTLQTYYQRYKVVACEEVTTALGTFSALKIQVDQNVAGAGSGGTYFFWYAPEVKASVKRQYVLSRYWSKTWDSELVKYERR
jgi:hypothetical protein